MDGLRAELQSSIQTTINLVALAMKGEVTDTGPMALPTENSMTVTFDARLQWDAVEAAARRDAWLLANAIRDCIESLSVFLESARRVLAVFALLESRVDGRISVEKYNNALVERDHYFHEFDLPTKIAHFDKVYGVTIDPTLADQMLSINRARNCLVHRGGVVGPKDLKGINIFKIKWRKWNLVFVGEDGIEKPLRFDEPMGSAGHIVIRVEDTERLFAVGERLGFTIDDLVSICWGLFLFGEHVVQAISADGVKRGFLTPLSSIATA
jgi:hypothetical protein